MTYRPDYTKEELRDALARADRILRSAYYSCPPRDANGRPVRPAKLAKMTRFEVNAIWDFEGRHLAHAIAKVLERP
jgi:hypothetical protein